MGGLLDELWHSTRLDCMSDLHTEAHRAMALRLLCEIDGDKYPVEDWNDAVGYLLETGRPPHFSTVAEARAYCLAQLDSGEAARDAPKEKRPAAGWLHRRRERPPAARAEDVKNGYSRRDADTEIGSE